MSYLKGLAYVTALMLFMLGTVAFMPVAGALAPSKNGAGLVVRHGDGTLVFVYVEFEGETISGEELLLRSGLDFVVTPFSGLGTGVCAINGEGCPADNCYCESYGNPAVYWQYFSRSSGGWDSQLRGPSTRQLADGDIDGWSWTAGDHGLPPVSIDEIAAITGFDRSPDPTATPPPAPTATPIPTETPVPTQPPSATPSPTSPPPATSTPSPTPIPTATALPSASPTAAATATATSTHRAPMPTNMPETPTQPPAPSATAAQASTSTASPTDRADPTTTTSAGAGAVIVRPGETPEAIEPAGDESGESSETLLLFGGAALLIVLVGSVVLVRNRRGE
ncbi:MAG: hypothetical protein R3A46_01685 [Thermomicrobiales bacterium]